MQTQVWSGSVPRPIADGQISADAAEPVGLMRAAQHRDRSISLDLVSELGLDQSAGVDDGAGEGEQRERCAFGAVVAQAESLEPQ